MTKLTTIRRLTLATTLGLASLSPLQNGLAALGLTLLTSGQAMAQQNQVPGVGIIIKKKPGNAPIAKGVSDVSGNFEHKGLQAGDYAVCFASDKGDGESCADAKVGKDGVIRGKAVNDPDRAKASKKHNYVGHVTLLR